MLLGTDGVFKTWDLVGGGQVIEGGPLMEPVGPWSPLFLSLLLPNN